MTSGFIPQITDFGISLFIEDQKDIQSTLTLTNFMEVGGTNDFMPIEMQKFMQEIKDKTLEEQPRVKQKKKTIIIILFFSSFS